MLRGAEYLRGRAEAGTGRVYVRDEDAAALLALHASALDDAIADAAYIGLPDSYHAPSEGSDVHLATWLVVSGPLATADVPAFAP